MENRTQEKKTSGGVYVGTGLSPVSFKLAQRIRYWEYVNMAELLPEVQLFGELRMEDQGAEDPQSLIYRPGCSAAELMAQCLPHLTQRQSQNC